MPLPLRKLRYLKVGGGGGGEQTNERVYRRMGGGGGGGGRGGQPLASPSTKVLGQFLPRPPCFLGH